MTNRANETALTGRLAAVSAALVAAGFPRADYRAAVHVDRVIVLGPSAAARDRVAAALRAAGFAVRVVPFRTRPTVRNGFVMVESQPNANPAAAPGPLTAAESNWIERFMND